LTRFKYLLIDRAVSYRRGNMNLYVVAKYLHVVGALVTFLALGLEWASLVQLRRAQTAEQAREWARVGGWLRWLGPIALGAVLVPGFYMMATVWRDGAPWIGFAFAALAMIVVLGVLGGRRFPVAIQAAVAEEGALSPAARARLRAPLPWISVQARAALLLAIVFLMTAKTDLAVSLWAIGVALLAAAAATAFTADRAPPGSL
jgi:uncharacterized membrane protein